MPRFCIVSAGWTRALALACSTLLIPLPAVSNEQSLPSLGSSSSSASSEEYRLRPRLATPIPRSGPPMAGPDCQRLFKQPD